VGAGPNLSALAAITEAVQAGAGLPEVLRAAGRALDASLILIDRSASILAVTARSPADERSLMRDTEGVVTIDLKVADATVGHLRMRTREHAPDPSMLSLVTTLIASEVERVRAPRARVRGGGDGIPAGRAAARDRRPRPPRGARKSSAPTPRTARRWSSSARIRATRRRMTGAGDCWRWRGAALVRSRRCDHRAQ